METNQNLVKLYFTVRDTTTEGEGTLDIWSADRAKKKGMMVWIGCWILAVLTIPIPLIHFGSVPTLLIFGPVAGRVVFKMFNGAIEASGSGSCPECTGPVSFSGRAATWPLQIDCPNCRAMVSVRGETQQAGNAQA